MAIVLAAAKPDVLSFSSTVTEVDDREIVLEESYFYPEGGGQPPDRGHIEGVGVIDVQVAGDEIIHSTASRPDFEVGETVTAHIDPAFRSYCQRIHTASHVVYGAGRRVLDDLGYGGFDIDTEKARIDFATTSDIGPTELVELERLANRIVWEHRPVRWNVLSKEKALARDGIAFNTKTEEGVTGDEIRVVEIDEWDVAACGGTHVDNTRDIGPISIMDRSNPGGGLTRIEVSVGPTAISHRASEKQSLLTAAEQSGSAPGTLPAKVVEYHEKIAELEQEKNRLEEYLVSSWKRRGIESVVTEGDTRWLVTSMDVPEIGILEQAAEGWVGDVAEVIILVSQTPRPQVVVAAKERSAEAIITQVVEEFGGGGGGNESFAQAGGLDASVDTVVAFFEREGITGAD